MSDADDAPRYGRLCYLFERRAQKRTYKLLSTRPIASRHALLWDRGDCPNCHIQTWLEVKRDIQASCGEVMRLSSSRNSSASIVPDKSRRHGWQSACQYTRVSCRQIAGKTETWGAVKSWRPPNTDEFALNPAEQLQQFGPSDWWPQVLNSKPCCST